MMPTPAAVLSAAELLSQGHGSERGMGELMVVDVGGATTDVHSIAKGDPSKASVTLRGLPEPFVKRTVEGDLGLRYSSEALVEAAGRRLFDFLGWSDDKVASQLSLYKEDPWRIPQTEEEADFDVAMGKVAVGLAVERHVGTIEVVYTPFGATYVQHGKDLTPLPVVIGTGGVFLYHPDALAILRGAAFDPQEPTILKPQNAAFYLDKEYILAAMGLLREVAPQVALRIMKRYVVKH